MYLVRILSNFLNTQCSYVANLRKGGHAHSEAALPVTKTMEKIQVK